MLGADGFPAMHQFGDAAAWNLSIWILVSVSVDMQLCESNMDTYHVGVLLIGDILSVEGLHSWMRATQHRC